MSIVGKVKWVEKVFKEIELDTGRFELSTGLHCVRPCRQCCIKPDIEATVLEFLPLAYSLYQRGIAHVWLDKLKETGDEDLCLLLSAQPGVEKQGHCREYRYRGLVCRLFGFSAVVDKYGSPVLATCDIIKKKFPANYRQAEDGIRKGSPIPIMKNYYFRLCSIDLALSRRHYRINTAIRYAIEEVLFYYLYREGAGGG